MSSEEISKGGSTVFLCIGSNSDFGKGIYNYLLKEFCLALCDWWWYFPAVVQGWRSITERQGAEEYPTWNNEMEG